jgi:hypothetical protein
MNLTYLDIKPHIDTSKNILDSNNHKKEEQYSEEFISEIEKIAKLAKEYSEDEDEDEEAESAGDI